MTDWHIGQHGEKERFPNLEELFFDDLKITLTAVGGVDLVFFTGDFVNRGTKEEYEELEKRLIRFWEEFSKYGKIPKLVVVPGNHDLARPSEYSPVSLALKNWNTDQHLRTAFWNDDAKGLREEVIASFSAYTNWLSQTKLPILASQKGPLPGDQLGTYVAADLSVSFLGLNTTFLQCRKGNFEGALWLSPHQIPQPDEGTYISVLRAADISVLLTHHPETWLAPESKSHFRSDIARNGVFDAHFCGHLHEAMSVNLSEGGSGHRQTFQGASFFGLEQFGEEGGTEKRIHGYTVGTWEKRDSRIHEKRWPRIATKKQDGGWGLVQDHTSYLSQDGSAHREWAARNVAHPEPTAENFAALKSDVSEHGFLDSVTTDALSSLPRIQPNLPPQHQSIRSEERQKLQTLIQNTAIVGIVADWGMGRDEFITSAIFGADAPSAIKIVAKTENIFILNCDAFESASDFELGFKQQFGLNLHQFSQATEKLLWACLVLDGVQQVVLEGSAGDKFRTILEVLSDYSQHLKIIVTGRVEMGSGVPAVQLNNLDLPETRTYIETHPRKRPDLLTIEAVERIHFSSGGLPIQIDSLLSRLEIASLDAVLEEQVVIEGGTSLHKSLLSCIRRLGSDSEDDSMMRSLELLRALSTLPYGATIELIKRFNPNHNFYPTHAEELRRLRLIDVIPLHYDVAALSGNPTKGCSTDHSPKILRVPKQVRDCVIADMSENDRKRQLDLAAEFIFGDKWKTGGKIRLRKLPFEYREYLGSGLGNEYTVVHALISSGVDEDNSTATKKALKLAIHYCGVLKGAERYKDLKMVSGSIDHLIDSLDYEIERRQLHSFCGRACRLTGDYSGAVRHLEAARALWPPGENDDQLGRMLLELCISYRGMDKAAEGKVFAELAASLAKKGSLLESQAKGELAMFNDKVTEQKEMACLEREARQKSWDSHANDLAIFLASGAKDQMKLELLDRVIQSNEEGRNKYRAVANKGKHLLNRRELEKLSLIDEVCLIKAYQYFHAQRSTAFSDCHDVIWALLEKRGKNDALYALFRHSSFIWRLEGKSDLELKYFKRLTDLKSQKQVEQDSGFVVEIAYFMKRAKILVLKLIPNTTIASSSGEALDVG